MPTLRSAKRKASMDADHPPGISMRRKHSIIITDLPDELLDRIILFTIGVGTPDYSTARGLVIVCRSFHRIATPFLYSHYDFGTKHLKVQHLFLRTLVENPKLGRWLKCVVSSLVHTPEEVKSKSIKGFSDLVKRLHRRESCQHRDIYKDVLVAYVLQLAPNITHISLDQGWLDDISPYSKVEPADVPPPTSVCTIIALGDESRSHARPEFFTKMVQREADNIANLAGVELHNFTKLAELHISVYSMHPKRLGLLFKLPALRILRLSGVSPNFPMVSIPWDCAPRTSSIEVLTLFTSFTSEVYLETLKDMFTSIIALKTFEFRELDSWPSRWCQWSWCSYVSDGLELHQESLEQVTVRIGTVPQVDLAKLSFPLRSKPTMIDITVETLLPLHDLSLPNLLLKLSAKLPPSVQQLTINFSRSWEPDTLLNSDQVGTCESAFPNLKWICIRHDTRTIGDMPVKMLNLKEIFQKSKYHFTFILDFTRRFESEKEYAEEIEEIRNIGEEGRELSKYIRCDWNDRTSTWTADSRPENEKQVGLFRTWDGLPFRKDNGVERPPWRDR
ncbi:hypothetical protein BCR34DRAFT_82738 [Clohesyomyces aquaticus]|uniref:F-box domain-containing protein n=1 Tax=Clohesyomyces aquaticus TaxID=1231657 RepID=A0A1Y1YWG2_9PLEO|nr:hypothetical protein BCR34DRAFT_82738 [Clohesyomyces aquaticus]